ncbi:hypothetical protein B0H19DRAFT_158789 [Mycena capillaripes]|nr:hypothetical protein B0H19DRAFT_158789 [Mycena capillaripes]
MLLPWGQLTHYRGTYYAQHQLEILKAAPNLPECSIGFEPTVTLQLGESHHVLLPYLRRLSINNPTILPHLAAPLVEDLFSRYNHLSDASAFFPFLDYCPRLTRLTLLVCALRVEIIDILRAAPALTYLHLELADDRETQTAVFNVLTTTDSSSVVCPNLSSFVYGFDGDIPVDAFFVMSHSRCQLGLARRLKRLRMFSLNESGAPCFPAIDEGMTKLRAEGLDAVHVERSDPEIIQARRDYF